MRNQGCCCEEVWLYQFVEDETLLKHCGVSLFQEVCIELHVTGGSCVPVLLRVKPYWNIVDTIMYHYSPQHNTAQNILLWPRHWQERPVCLNLTIIPHLTCWLRQNSSSVLLLVIVYTLQVWSVNNHILHYIYYIHSIHMYPCGVLYTSVHCTTHTSVYFSVLKLVCCSRVLFPDHWWLLRTYVIS